MVLVNAIVGFGFCAVGCAERCLTGGEDVGMPGRICAVCLA